MIRGGALALLLALTTSIVPLRAAGQTPSTPAPSPSSPLPGPREVPPPSEPGSPAPEAGPEGPAVPAPVGFVNDAAGVLDETTRAQLEGFLDQVKRKTGAEFAILVMPTTAPVTPTEYKTRVFDAWKLGKKGEDTGLLMLIALKEREVRFETGYGLEGTVPDGFQSRVFRDVMAPRFRENDYAGGTIAGVQAVAARIAREKGVTLEWNGRELRYDRSEDETPMPRWIVPLVVFALIVILSSVARSGRRRGGWGGFGGWGGMGGWGGGLGGGGFGGWGGGFGGGGGGGPSFGGFGGGASGGGGGGGKW
jgi:uncharacterized protein